MSAQAAPAADPPPPPWYRRVAKWAWSGRGVFWGLIAIFVGASVVAIIGAVGVGEPKPDHGKVDCPKPTAEKPMRSAAPVPTEKTPLTLTRTTQEVAELAFQEHRDPGVIETVFDANRAVSRKERSLGISLVSDLERADHAARFPREQTRASAIWSHNKRHVLIELCLDPNQASVVDPGRYDGAMEVDGPSFGEATVPIEVTLRETRWWLVIAWSVASALAGVIVKLVTDSVKLQTPPEGTSASQLQANGGQPIGTYEALVRNAGQLTFLVSFAVGFVVAIGAFFTIYLNNDTFGTSSNDWFKLTASCFGATVSGMTITDLGKRLPTNFFSPTDGTTTTAASAESQPNRPNDQA